MGQENFQAKIVTTIVIAAERRTRNCRGGRNVNQYESRDGDYRGTEGATQRTGSQLSQPVSPPNTLYTDDISHSVLVFLKERGKYYVLSSPQKYCIRRLLT